MIYERIPDRGVRFFLYCAKALAYRGLGAAFQKLPVICRIRQATGLLIIHYYIKNIENISYPI